MSDDSIDILHADFSRFDKPDLSLMFTSGEEYRPTRATRYRDFMYHWAPNPNRLPHLFAASRTDQISQVLFLLAQRLTASPSSSRDTELRHYGVPLSEAFKVAIAEYPSISIDPNVMAGAPCIGSTRIPVYMVLDAIEGYGDLDAAITSYPRLTIQQVKDAIGFAKLVVECPVE